MEGIHLLTEMASSGGSKEPRVSRNCDGKLPFPLSRELNSNALSLGKNVNLSAEHYIVYGHPEWIH